MILPLIVFLMILAMIIFMRWRRNQDEPEGLRDEPKKPGKGENGNKPRKKIILKPRFVVLAILIVAAIFYRDDIGKWLKSLRLTEAAADYPLCVDQKSHSFWDGSTQIKVPLHSSCWSGQIMLPPQTKFMVDTPSKGDLEYRFWDGRRRLVPDGKAAWLGRISYSSFQLRGNGEAIITIEKG